MLIRNADLIRRDSELPRATVRVLEHAFYVLNRTVLLVSSLPPMLLIGSDAAADIGIEWHERWARLVATFMVVPVGDASHMTISRPAWANALGGTRLGSLLWSNSMGFLSDEASDSYKLGTFWSPARRFHSMPLSGSSRRTNGSQGTIAGSGRPVRPKRGWSSCRSPKKAWRTRRTGGCFAC